MSEKTVLIVEPEDSLRQLWSRELTADGFEVVPTASAEEGTRFAIGLGVTAIVAPVFLSPFAAGQILERLPPAPPGSKRTLLLLGKTEEEERGLPGEVIFLPMGGLDRVEVARRIGIVLAGRNIGLEPGPRLDELIGDLAETPLLQLVGSLQSIPLSGYLELERGAIFFRFGEVVAAQAGSARGRKAFCRLARLTESPFRVVFDSETSSASAIPGVEREIEEKLSSLINAAIRDSMGQFPDGRSRIFPARRGMTSSLTATQRRILQLADRGPSVLEVLDAFEATDGEVVRELLEMEDQKLVELREFVQGVQILTDSTSDLPLEIARDNGIRVVPLHVHFGQKTFKDRVDLYPGDFYRILEQRIAHPSSSPPDEEELRAALVESAERGNVVLLTLSSKLSETCEVARRAAKKAEGRVEPGRVLEVVDSQQTSMGLGLLAVFGARMAARGARVEEIVARLDEIRQRIGMYFVVDTLEFLARGGRIGKVSAFVGGLLNVKPLLALQGGEILKIDQVRGRRAAQPRLMEIANRSLDPKRPTVVAITHAKAPAWAERLRKLVEEQIVVSELILSETGPVIGTHVGPGAFSLVFFQPTESEIPWIAPLDS